MSEHQIVKVIAREETLALRMSTTHCRHDQVKGLCARCRRQEEVEICIAWLDNVTDRMDAMVEAGEYDTPEYWVLSELYCYGNALLAELSHP